MGTITFEQYQISWVFGQVTAAVRKELVAFWLDNGALDNPFEAWRRSFEVACTVRDTKGHLLGVSSVYTAIFAPTGEAHWFYRTFLHRQARTPGVSIRVLQHTSAQLEAAFSGEPGAPRGLIFITENPKLDRPAAQRILRRNGSVLLGRDASGKSVWQRMFA